MTAVERKKMEKMQSDINEADLALGRFYSRIEQGQSPGEAREDFEAAQRAVKASLRTAEKMLEEPPATPKKT